MRFWILIFIVVFVLVCVTSKQQYDREPPPMPALTEEELVQYIKRWNIAAAAHGAATMPTSRPITEPE